MQTAISGHGGVHHEVLSAGGAGALGQGESSAAAASRGGGHDEALLQQEEKHQVSEAAGHDGG